jgi:hypothetical protein
MPNPQRSRTLLALALLGIALPALSSAQDLAAIAKKEKARRAKVTKPVKVLTEKDGEEAATKGAGSVTALQSDGTTSSADAAKLERQPTGSTAEGQEAMWRSRAEAARAAVASAEKAATQAERALEAYRSDMAPSSAADLQDPMREQKRAARIYEMTKQLEASKAGVAEARKALTALEEDARSQGVPAGWLR